MNVESIVSDKFGKEIVNEVRLTSKYCHTSLSAEYCALICKKVCYAVPEIYKFIYAVHKLFLFCSKRLPSVLHIAALLEMFSTTLTKLWWVVILQIGFSLWFIHQLCDVSGRFLYTDCTRYLTHFPRKYNLSATTVRDIWGPMDFSKTFILYISVKSVDCNI